MLGSINLILVKANKFVSIDFSVSTRHIREGKDGLHSGTRQKQDPNYSYPRPDDFDYPKTSNQRFRFKENFTDGGEFERMRVQHPRHGDAVAQTLIHGRGDWKKRYCC